MTDEKPNVPDDTWIDALLGKDSPDSEDARLIRASLLAHEDVTSEQIGDDEVEAAKQKLLNRVSSEKDETADSTVVDLASRRSAGQRDAWMPRRTGMLLAASVAFVAIVVMMIRGPGAPDGPIVLMSYEEIDTIRGARDDNVLEVEDPDAFGRELGNSLMEREIPFALITEGPDAPDRIISIQVDGVANAAGLQEVLEDLNIQNTPNSVVTIRLVPEP